MNKKRKEDRTFGRPKGSGSQFIYDEIRNRILTLYLKPGADIEELSLGNEFSVSRTPVREALIRLEADGLVQIVPNRGVRVAALDIDNIGKLFEALDLYSRAICHLAALRKNPVALEDARKASAEFTSAAREKNYREMGEANWRYHLELGRASGNRYLTDAQTRTMNETMRLAYLVHYESGMRHDEYREYFARISDEHEQMIAHIENGNISEAEQFAGQHTRLFQENLSRYLLRHNLAGVQVDEAIGML